MKIIFGNFKELVINYFSASDKQMLVKTEYSTQEELEEIFRDPVATREIVYDVDGDQKTYTNYTEFEEIRKDKKDVYTVIMTKSGEDLRTQVSDLTGRVESLEEAGTDVTGNTELMQVLNYSVRSLTDEEILKVPNYVEKWKADTEYKKDDRLGYVVNGNVQLYKVIQDHTSQADWTPDKTASLYTPIGKPEEGTKENPIPWVSGMESEEGKYYTDEGVLYIGLEDSGIGLTGQPKDLERYFKKVEE